MPDTILFDLDGTLIDSTDIVVDAYYNGLIEHGLPVKDKKYIATLAGKSTYNTGRGLGVPEDKLDKIDQYFWTYFLDMLKS